MSKKNRIVEPEVLPPELDADLVLAQARTLINKDRASLSEGKFQALHEEFHSQLAQALAEQEEIAKTTLRVINRTTKLMRTGLERSLELLQSQVDASRKR